MPGYAWLEKAPVDGASLPIHMSGLRTLGAPYSDDEITKSTEEVQGKTELDAVISYLQVMGIHRK
jgi:cytochrome c oxidase cbb3-type subunit 2